FSSTAYAVGIQPQCVVAADVNGDGKLDLISANGGTNTLTILTNNGSGIFGSYATYTIGSHPFCVAAADVNGDGKLDLISANLVGDSLTILTNNGFGIFSSNATLNVGGNCKGVTAADVNGDGKVDLIAANITASSLTVFTNNGSGIFSSNATYAVGATDPAKIITADVNGDGKPDLISVNSDINNTVTVLTNDGSGHFVFCSSYDAGSLGNDAAAADVNGDGKPDLIIADGADEIVVATNNGSGHFTDTLPDNSNYNLANNHVSANSIAVADVNGDGKPDLIGVSFTGFIILTNDGGGNFSLAYSANFSGLSAWLTAADVNGDGQPDFIVATETGNSLEVLTQMPQFTSVGAHFTAASFTGDGSGLTNLNASQISSGTISAGQLPATVITNGASGVNLSGTISGTISGDGAGVTNVSFSSIGNNPFTLTLNLETNFSTAYTVGKQPEMLVAADMNGDGKLDLISANSGDNTLTVLTNNGSGVFGSSATYSVGSQPLYVVAADVNGDGKLDLISANSGDNTLTILTNNGFGIFGSNASINVGTEAPSVAAADVNGDGKVDLITANRSGTTTIFTNDGFGHFSSNATYPVGTTQFAQYVTAADMNGDGKPDLVFGNFDSGNTVTVLTNDGSGHFAFCSSYGNGSYITYITTADMNGDGKPDLIFTGTSGQITVATNDGSSHFTDTLPDEAENASGYYSFANINFVTTADANGDGKPDLVFIAIDDNNFYNLGIATNDGSGNFTLAFSQKMADLYADQDWIAPADFNGDGKMDFAVSDYSSNSVTVFAGDGNSVAVLPPAPQVEQAQAVIGSGIMAFTNSQNNFIGAFTGDGGGLTNLNAAQITSGRMAAAQLPDISQLNGTLATAQLPSAVITNNESGVTLSGTFSGDASGLANLKAAQISGALSTAQLPSAVVTNNESGVALGGVNVNGNMKITGGLAIDASATDTGVVSSNTSLLFGGPDSGEGIGSERVTNGPAKQYSLDFYTSSSQRMTILLNGNVGIGTNTPANLLDVAGNIHAAGTFSGNGSGLTNLNASQISGGIISAAQLPSGVVTNNESGVALGGTFSGNGSGLTNTVTSGNYLFAYSTAQQSIENNGVFEAITFGHRPSINGWTYGSSSGSFTNAQTGLYLIQYDAVAEESYAVPSAVTLDMTVNGAEIPGSQTTTTLTVLNHPFFVSKSFIASLNSGDVAQLRFLGDDSSLYLQNGLGNGTNDPSATLTITRLQ
ncbi:MAG TPA: FG-GAP-like repeat-containing protein, partial [Verrucomicrobiae bacterium]